MIKKKGKTEILHLTTSHRAEDNRIYFCEANSISKNYSVTVMGLNPRDVPPIDVQMLKMPEYNMAKKLLFALKSGVSLKPKLIHIHDPEMLFVVPLFRLFGIRIIYDIHEDYQKKFRSNKNLPDYLCNSWWVFERIISKCCIGIIVADSHLSNKFKFHQNVICIGNFPPLSFVLNNKRTNPFNSKKVFKICYVGTIHEHRGLAVAVDAVDRVSEDLIVELHVIGECKYPRLLEKFEKSKRTRYHGRIPWDKLNIEMLNFDLGLALFQPVSAFTYYPGENIVKLFEYAGMGLPFLISDFPSLRPFLEKNKVGVMVDPTNPAAIAAEIERLILNPDLYIQLSKAGIKMVEEEYNWEAQEHKLLDFYKKIMD